MDDTELTVQERIVAAWLSGYHASAAVVGAAPGNINPEALQAVSEVLRDGAAAVRKTGRESLATWGEGVASAIVSTLADAQIERSESVH